MAARVVRRRQCRKSRRVQRRARNGSGGKVAWEASGSADAAFGSAGALHDARLDRHMNSAQPAVARLNGSSRAGQVPAVTKAQRGGDGSAAVPDRTAAFADVAARDRIHAGNQKQVLL